MKESLGYPYVEPRIKRARKQRPTTIELHISQTTSDKGAALAIALNQHNHEIEPFDYIVDDEEIIECTNKLGRTIKVLICAQPHEREPLWEGASAKRVMYQSAALVAELCHVHNIKVRYVTEESRFKFKGGILCKVVGYWPFWAYLRDVKANLDIIHKQRSPNA